MNGLGDKFSNKYFPISTRNDDTNTIETHYHLHLVTNYRAHTTGTNNRNLSLGVPNDTLNSRQILYMLSSIVNFARFDSRRRGFSTQCHFAIPVQHLANETTEHARTRLSSVPMQLPQSIFSNSIHHRHSGRCGSSVPSCSQLFQSQPLPHPFTSSFCVASHTTKTLRRAAHVWKLDHNLRRVATLFKVHTLLQLCKPGWPRPCMLHPRRRWAASGRIRNRCSYRWRDPN